MDVIQYKFICNTCHYLTNNPMLYKQHIKTQKHITGKKKSDIIYKCNVCIFESYNEMNYKTHLLNNHSSIDERKNGFKFFCEHCNFGVFVKVLMDRHEDTKKHRSKIENCSK